MELNWENLVRFFEHEYHLDGQPFIDIEDGDCILIDGLLYRQQLDKFLEKQK